jgi:hypothetical protein
MAALVLPFHDTTGLMFHHLDAVTPRLRALFERTFISLSPATERARPADIERLAGDAFFVLNRNALGTQPGEHYRAAFASAVAGCAPEQVLHIANVDRVAFALQTEHAAQFAADVAAAGQGPLPLFFQRSPVAWATHPRNYREAEQAAIQLGQARFGRTYDFAWSHLVLRAGQLAALLPRLRSRDFGLLAEMLLRLRRELHTQAVDWLAWEDPFIYGRDPDELRREREADPAETQKRADWNRPLWELVANTDD